MSHEIRESVIEAAIDEMNAHGMRFTMDDVARRLRVGKATLYKQVGSKDNLIHGIFEYLMKGLDKELDAINLSEASAYEKVCAYNTAYTAWLGKLGSGVLEELSISQPSEIKRWNEFCAEKVRGGMAILRQGMEQGELRETNLKLVQQSIILLFGAIMEHDFLRDINMTHSDALRGITDLLFNGIRKRDA